MWQPLPLGPQTELGKLTGKKTNKANKKIQEEQQRRDPLSLNGQSCNKTQHDKNSLLRAFEFIKSINPD